MRWISTSALRRRQGQSPRPVITAIRRSSLQFARTRQRPDLARLFEEPAAETTEARTQGRRRDRDPGVARRCPRLPSPTTSMAGCRRARCARCVPMASGPWPISRSACRAGAAGGRALPGSGATGAKADPSLLRRASRRSPNEPARWCVWTPAATWCPGSSSIVPEDVDGSRGTFRGPAETCTLSARNDYEAVNAWLSMHESPATQRAYRKEAERVILWAVLERGRALSSLTHGGCGRLPRVPAAAVAAIALGRAGPTAHGRRLEAVCGGPVGAIRGLCAVGAGRPLPVAHRAALLAGQSIRGDQGARGRTARRTKRSCGSSPRANGPPSSRWPRASNGATAGRCERRSGCGSCWTSPTPRACASANWSAPGSARSRLDGHGDQWLHLVGKGGKNAKVALPSMARAALDRYLMQRQLPITPSKWDPGTFLIGSIEGDASRHRQHVGHHRRRGCGT